LVTASGYGNCQKKYNGKPLCYVELPSSCNDLQVSHSSPGEKWSLEACSKGASEYVVLDKNELCKKQSIIDDENECTVAAKSSGYYNDAHSEDTSDHPRGCYVLDSRYIWFNKHHVGNTHKNAAPICRRDHTYRVGQYCSGSDIEIHTTLQAAETACSNNVECGCIYNAACDGDRWRISKGYEVTPSSIGSCAWTSTISAVPADISPAVSAVPAGPEVPEFSAVPAVPEVPADTLISI